MAHHHIIIETHKTDAGFRADVVEGPPWAVGYSTTEEGRNVAYYCLKSDVRANLNYVMSGDTYDFMHVAT
jgi:hypothetical protein